MKAAVEKVVFLYAGAEPSATEIRDIIRAVEELGFDTEGVVISAYGGSAVPTESIAQFFLLRLEGEGKLSANALERAIIRPMGAGENQAVVAIVKRDSARHPDPASAASVTPPTERRRRTLFGKRR